MLAEAVLESGRNPSLGLKALIYKYLNITMDKEVRETFQNFSATGKITPEQLKYSALDVLLLFPLFELQFQRLKKENMMNVAKLEFATAPVVAEMELKGVYIDKKKWREIIANLEIKRDALAIEFQNAIRPLKHSGAKYWLIWKPFGKSG